MILKFLNTAINLKEVPRQGWIDKLSIEKPESVAEHVFSMAITGMIFSDLKKYNTEKILKIILLHDLSESIIGDITPGQIPISKKRNLENNAMKKILSELPESLQSQYNRLWDEYIQNTSSEARFVHQLDKLEMALQAKYYLNEGHPKERLESFFNSAKNEITDKKLLKIFNEITNHG
ncbi:HD domain-containing protein [Candidatus Nitrosarchaeum limnium]|uniref:5'-deoxynucleotidase n=1 Tax=Candidatus Nitrosarchaeum limnium BG20 TaxID=859192 RepID=S2ESL6_9ARCH|nr:HD domain-containing protein [Candidatus Nitrosarchaeum limnium]EPA05374.1 hypothetical protein BG20_I2149 [Candidatus Nitrosarchaeum limnium BG20]